MRLPVFALLFAICIPCLAQQGSIVSGGDVYLYNTDSERELAEGLIRQHQALDALRQSFNDQNFEFRNPTPEEIAERVAAWNKANPFKLSTEMPDYSRQKVRVPKSTTNDAGYLELAAKIANVEAQLFKLQHTSQSVQAPQPARKKVAVPKPPPEPERPPNPNSIAIIKHQDGSVVALIGSKLLKFKNEAEANAYIAKLNLPPIKR